MAQGLRHWRPIQEICTTRIGVTSEAAPGKFHGLRGRGALASDTDRTAHGGVACEIVPKTMWRRARPRGFAIWNRPKRFAWRAWALHLKPLKHIVTARTVTGLRRLKKVPGN